MKLTNKQAHYLVHLLQDTLSMNVVGYLSTDAKFRNELLNEILNQQSNELISLSELLEPTGQPLDYQSDE